MKFKKAIKVIVFLLLVTAALVPFSSSLPDGLEWVAGELKFIDKEKSFWEYAPFADYVFPFIRSDWLATAVAGIFGTIAVFVLGIFCFNVLAFFRKDQ